MTIAEAQQEDLAQILDLQKDCYQQEAKIYNDYSIPPLLQTLDSMKRDFGEQMFLKIQRGDRIIGSVRGKVESGACQIGRLIVHQDFQNQGLGKQLMRAIEERFLEVQRYELFTGYRSHKNLSLYKQIGYAEFRREKINSKLTLIFLEKVKNDL